MTDRIRGVFEQAGYGEVYTPALEYERTFVRGNLWITDPAYRVFDEQGNVLVLRSDMTVPIARVAATRYAHLDPPLRFCYQAHAYRGVRPQRGQSREFLQAGIELIGSPAPEGTAEVLTVLCAALDAAGLRTYRVGLGDASLYPSLLESLSVPATARERILAELAGGDFVGVEREIRSLGLTDQDIELLLGVTSMRGGPDLLDGLTGALEEAATGMRAVHALLAAGGGVADHLRLRAGAQPRLLHGRGVPGLRPRPRGPDRQRGPLRRAARSVRAAAAGGRLRAQRRAGAHCPDR